MRRGGSTKWHTISCDRFRSLDEWSSAPDSTAVNPHKRRVQLGVHPSASNDNCRATMGCLRKVGPLSHLKPRMGSILVDVERSSPHTGLASHLPCSCKFITTGSSLVCDTAFTQFSRGLLLWVLRVSSVDNSPSSNSTKQSKYKCVYSSLAREVLPYSCIQYGIPSRGERDITITIDNIRRRPFKR